MKVLLLILLFSFSLGFEPVQSDQDAANHALVSAGITKFVNAFTKDEQITLLIMTTIFISKEIYDCVKPNPSGFSITDLVFDYAGYNLIMVKWEF